MADLPEPYKKPQFSPKLVGWAVVAGATAAIAAAVLVSAAPPPPYSNLLAATVASAVAIGVGLFLAALVLLVSQYFRKRYTKTEASIADYQEEMALYQEATAARLDEIAEQQRLLIAMVCDLTDRANTICRDQKVLRNRVERWKGEVTVLAEAVDELRTIFVEEGLPGRSDRLEECGAGLDPAPLYCHVTRIRASVFSSL